MFLFYPTYLYTSPNFVHSSDLSALSHLTVYLTLTPLSNHPPKVIPFPNRSGPSYLKLFRRLILVVRPST